MNNALPAIPLAGVTAPRIDEYFGLWAYEPGRFASTYRAAASMNLIAHVGEAREARQAAELEVIGRSAGALGDERGVAIVPVVGTLMKQTSSLDDSASSTIELRRLVREAKADPTIGSVMLYIDSPGGTVAGLGDLADDIRALAEAKPVVAFVADLGASAAYRLAVEASAIYANQPDALVGSIGTIIALYDYSAQAEAEGIEALVFATGAIKGAGFPGARVTDDQRAYYQGIVDESQAGFDAAVIRGRGITAAQLENVRTGAVFHADKATAAGLIDGVQSFDATIAELMELANPTHTTTTGANAMSDNATNAGQEVGNVEPTADATVEADQVVETPEAEQVEPQAEATADEAVDVEPEASTYEQLRAALPNAAPEFREAMIGKTVADATAAYIANLEARVADLEGAAAELAGDEGVQFNAETSQAGGHEAPTPKAVSTLGHNVARVAAAMRFANDN